MSCNLYDFREGDFVITQNQAKRLRELFEEINEIISKAEDKRVIPKIDIKKLVCENCGANITEFCNAFKCPKCGSLYEKRVNYD